jgi:hypothetical protein
MPCPHLFAYPRQGGLAAPELPGEGGRVCNWPDFWYALCLNYDLYGHQ